MTTAEVMQRVINKLDARLADASRNQERFDDWDKGWVNGYTDALRDVQRWARENS